MALLAFILGITGNITAFLGLVSPMPTFWRILKKGSTGSFSAQPYLFSLMSALFWMYYGILKHGGIFVMTISAISSGFQIFYLSIYLWFANSQQRKKAVTVLSVILISFASVVLSTIFLEHGKQPIVTVGIVCIITSVFSTGAPLTIIHKVVKTGSVEYMPLALSLGLFLNGTCWFAYSLALKDMFLLIPNAIGVTLSIVQLLIYFFYRIIYKPTIKSVDVGDHSIEASKAKDCPSLKDVETMANSISSETFEITIVPNAPKADEFEINVIPKN
ncbi:hypothetical protein KP509_18G081100 [Ceratopteris richardii]|uniref:Bidirectional sugar transporter SWEET n=1 Tax=Ceratopteris richardii TaxID=49495 RepID=A0A8T2SW00_CERRI|nr:hypothetical protein KP509_18G081100 [Ceratopteris richardii]